MVHQKDLCKHSFSIQPLCLKFRLEIEMQQPAASTEKEQLENPYLCS